MVKSYNDPNEQKMIGSDHGRSFTMRKSVLTIVACVSACIVLAGCGKTEEAATSVPAEQAQTGQEDAAPAQTSGEAKEEVRSDEPLAKRLVGKYSYSLKDETGTDECITINVVEFGDNLYAFCGRAIDEGEGKLTIYSFWASEFIPFDASALKSKDSDSVEVNELCFSLMSNDGKYWNSGYRGTITVVDHGLLFEGFENEGCLVSANGQGRLFVKDERVQPAFGYLLDDEGDPALSGLWVYEDEDVPLYFEFDKCNMYMYRKNPDKEVFFAAGGCEFSDGTFSCMANQIENGGMPFEMDGEYEVDADTLTLTLKGTDTDSAILEDAKLHKADPEDIHIVTMDEVKFTDESFGPFGSSSTLSRLNIQGLYGVFVTTAKNRDDLAGSESKLEEAGFMWCPVVYTPDFSELNPEPFYALAAGLYESKTEADKTLEDVKKAGFSDAYVKYTGTYVGNRYWYTMTGSEKTEVKDDCVILCGVSVYVPYPANAGSVKTDLVVDKDAVFDKSADMQYFANYEEGQTPYEWIVNNNGKGSALSGIFEVSLDDDHVRSYYGSYGLD